MFGYDLTLPRIIIKSLKAASQEHFKGLLLVPRVSSAGDLQCSNVLKVIQKIYCPEQCKMELPRASLTVQI